MNIIRRNGSAKDVAEKWRKQYKKLAGWTTTISGPSDKVYDALIALGESRDRQAINAVIGNESWTSVWCSSCGTDVCEAVEFGDEYGDCGAVVCKECIKEAAALLVDSDGTE